MSDDLATLIEMQRRDPAQWAALQRRIEAAATPPGVRGDYPHREGCRHAGTDPRWELVDATGEVWRRSCPCSVTQYSEPTAPPPPRPPGAEVEEFVRPHGAQHVEEPRLERAPGDVRPCWTVRCRECQATRRWRSEAVEHYRRHGVRITNRPPASFTVEMV